MLNNASCEPINANFISLILKGSQLIGVAMFRGLITRQPNLMLALLALTLAIRVIVPSGFMPTTDADGMIRISMCSGMAPQAVWMDKSGQLHKEAPSKDHHDPKLCGFGMLAFGLATPSSTVIEPMLPFGESAAVRQPFTVAVGRGLATRHRSTPLWPLQWTSSIEAAGIRSRVRTASI